MNVRSQKLLALADAIDRAQHQRRRATPFLSKPYTYIKPEGAACLMCGQPPERIRAGQAEEVLDFGGFPIPISFEPCGHLISVTAEEADLVWGRTERQLAPAEQLAQFFEGEEPYTDSRAIPTPAQWIWKWNRATPARRLEVAEAVLRTQDAAQRCLFGDHQSALDELREARAALCNVRLLAADLEAAEAHGGAWDANQEAARRLRAALGEGAP
ncbi:hypothetical protein [Streptomyces sp. NBC_00140]|uniref:hypothetical protein n=1 Tax=Streptomyces sp. NBC_00140 TaxID=2975664 RepID=UPI002259AEDD|nr:hypothetical protein [Streptomyces sp. NBC_00140]MCX5335484.1 hypothetical protein [Streptomyces sp. NBC_00140]MCX5338336.1 hypothetical protein [Streptomyces sp. NBC_00140]